MEINLTHSDNEFYVSSRIVAEGFGIEHDSLCLSLSKHFTDLESTQVKNKKTGRPNRVFLLSEKQIAILPALIRPTDKTIQFQTALVDAFFDARKKLSSPKSQDEIMEGLIQHGERLLKEKKALLEKIQRDAPKVEFFDRVITPPSDADSIGAFAKQLSGNGGLKLGRGDLFKWLRYNKYLFYENKINVPYQRYVEQGLFVLKEHLVNDIKRMQVMITTKGKLKVGSELLKEGKISLKAYETINQEELW